jgi:glycine cleavage system H protein
MRPEDLKFSKTHEWVHLDGTTQIATVGISAFALEALTDLVFVELPKVGTKLKVGSPFGEIESVKAVSDLYSPVDGDVTAVHSELSEKLDVLKSDPYGEGWLVKLTYVESQHFAGLMSYEDYQKQCSEAGH